SRRSPTERQRPMIQRPVRAALGLWATLTFAVAPRAGALPGDLDPTFGTGGTVRTLSGQAQDMLLDGSGRIVLGGFSYSGSAFELDRYNPDGSLDGSFGSGGRARAAVGGS